MEDGAPGRENGVVGLDLVREPVAQHLGEHARTLPRHFGRPAGAIGAEPDDAPRAGGDDGPGTGQENPGPVRAERGEDHGIPVHDGGDAGRVVHIARHFPQVRGVGQGDPLGITRDGGHGVTTSQRLSGEGDSGLAGGREDGEVHAENVREHAT